MNDPHPLTLIVRKNEHRESARNPEGLRAVICCDLWRNGSSEAVDQNGDHQLAESRDKTAGSSLWRLLGVLSGRDC